MQSINVFHKGVVADLDPSKRDNQSWDFPTLNIRIANHEGQGYIVTNVNGNDYDVSSTPDDTIGIELPSGFAPIGACELNGIAYIISHNSVTGEGEIGCFPSPAVITDVNYNIPSVTLGGATGFKRRYRPLVNYNTISARHPFRTTELTLNHNYQIDIFAAASYDNSVDLYLADGLNFNRIINSGFNDEGELTSAQIYSDESFPFTVAQIPLVNKIPRKKEFFIQRGGALLSGNYFLHARYVTKNFNRTHHLSEIGPISIASGTPTDKYSVEGIRGDSGDSGLENRSDKRISLTLENLDQQYEYVEISYSRHWSDESGVIIDETFTLDKLYNIKSNEIEIIFDGRETLLDLDVSELIAPAQKDLIAESHTIVDNRYFGVNWKQYGVHNKHLAEHAKRIVPGFNDGYRDQNLQIDINVGYKDPINIAEMLGYFRYETYPVGVVYVFKGGIETDVYPTAGVDDIDNLGVVLEEDGIYRFPSNGKSPNYEPGLIPKLNVLGITFSTSSTANNHSQSADNYKANNQAWFDANIEGFYFVRGDRFKNMLYQGHMMYGCRSYRAKTNGNYTGDYQGIVEQREEPIFGNNYDNPQGATQHGGSNITFRQNGINAGSAEYYKSSQTLPSDAVGIMWSSDVDGNSEWAVWLGQPHKKFTEKQAASSFFGANRTDTESGLPGGGADENVSGKGDANECIYNDRWLKDGVETGLVMPMYKGYFPNIDILAKDDEKPDKQFSRNYHNKSFYVEKKYSFISPDYLLNEIAKAPEGSIMLKLAKYDYIENDNGNGLPMSSINSSRNDTYPWWWFADCDSFIYWVTPPKLQDATYTDVPKYTRIGNAKDGFVSEYTDPGFEIDSSFGFSKTSTCMWYWTEDDQRVKGAGNRSMSTCKYIGVTFQDHKNDLNNTICAVYQNDPDSMTSNLADYFDLKNERYYKISEIIDINTTPTQTFFRGDCFLQKTYVKQMSWRGSTWKNNYDIESDWTGSEKDNREEGWIFGEDTQKLINVGHGLVIGIVTENTINSELRVSVDERTFYPKCGEDGLKAFAVFNPDTSDKTEAMTTNAGYSQVTSMKTYRNYNLQLPFVNSKNETRIRYSDKLIIGSFVNSFRNLRIANYEDYETRRGPMLRCFNHLNYLVSYQQEGINMHYVGDRQAKVDTDQGSIFMGSGEALAKEVKILANTGIQHKWAAIKGDKGILSLDWNKRTVNYVSLGVVGTTSTLMSKDYTKEKMLSTHIYDICEGYHKLTDIKDELPDTIMSGIGIYSGYDRKYGELYLSVKYPGHESTLVFNEFLDLFVGEISFVSPFYLTLNNDFYSVYWNGTVHDSNRVYLHDIDTQIQTFYGITHPMKLSVIVNGFSAEQNTVNQSKRYSSLEIESSEVGLSEIEYTTLKQIGFHDNFDLNDTRFWLAPEYSEGKWRFPIQAQTSGQPFPSIDEMDIGSDMRGEWIKVELKYTGTERQFIKSIITNYEISNF